MDNEQMILQAIAQLTDTVTKGFQDMEGRFEGIENRLDGQERKLRRTAVPPFARKKPTRASRKSESAGASP